MMTAIARLGGILMMATVTAQAADPNPFPTMAWDYVGDDATLEKAQAQAPGFCSRNNPPASPPAAQRSGGPSLNASAGNVRHGGGSARAFGMTHLMHLPEMGPQMTCGHRG